MTSRMTLVIEELFLHIDLRKDMNTDIQEKRKNEKQKRKAKIQEYNFDIRR